MKVHFSEFEKKNKKVLAEEGEEVELCNFKDIAEEIEKKLDCKITSHFIQIGKLCSECK